MVSSALENEGVKNLITELEAQIENINEELLNSTSEQLNDYTRDRRIDEKRIYTRIVSYFKSAPDELKNIEAKIDNEL